MVNYNNGKIYKIEPLNGEEGDIYVGSTTKEYLSQRMDAHRTNYKCFLNGKRSKTTSFILFNKYGVSNCNIILLELGNVNSKDELLIRESHYIKSLKCVNKQIPLRTSKEYDEFYKDEIRERKQQYYKDNIDKIKEYYTDNLDKIRERRHKYAKNNKDKINEKCKEYYKQNKDKIKETKKEYYQQNKDKLKEYGEEYYQQNKDKLKEYREAKKKEQQL